MLLLLLLSHFSRVWLCATPQTAAHQARSQNWLKIRNFKWFNLICYNQPIFFIEAYLQIFEKTGEGLVLRESDGSGGGQNMKQVESHWILVSATVGEADKHTHLSQLLGAPEVAKLTRNAFTLWSSSLCYMHRLLRKKHKWPCYAWGFRVTCRRTWMAWWEVWNKSLEMKDLGASESLPSHW